MEYFTVRYRLYPSLRQATLILETASACRSIYSAALDDMIAQHKRDGTILTPTLKDYQRDSHFNLSEIDPLALTQRLFALERDFAASLAQEKYPPYPRAKSSSFYCTPAKGGRVRIEGNRLLLPGIGPVPVVLHRPVPPRRLINVTVVQNASGNFYASMLFQQPYTRPLEVTATTDNTLGLDYSVPLFYVDSNGESPDHPRFYEVEEKKIAALQAKLRRMQKGSKNYEKTRRKLARLYERITNRRRDWLHKESRRLADHYDFIAVEDLNLISIAGTYNLGPHTMDNAYRTFLDMLEYKMSWQGKALVKINRWARSSQTCHQCGYINRRLTLGTRFWTCPQCGSHNSRDHNAALNIRNRVLKYRA